MMTPKLKKFFDIWKERVDHSLEKFLPPETTSPRTIHKAMRYSVFAGGKRLRPILVVAGAEICGLKGKKVLPTACAMELIHTYSLVHDDLPAMDDDDVRRGMPTNHKVFGEAIAILAGDSLLTYAFNLIAKNGKIINSASALSKVLALISDSAGFNGMVGGQVVDIEMGEGKWFRHPRKKQIEILRTIHETKTAALIKSSILAGAFWAQAGQKEIKCLSGYGHKIGLAFQIADDILDIVGDKKLLGKKGSDRSNRKLTYPAIFGLEKSKSEALRLVQEAKRDLKIFGARSGTLIDLADFIAKRTH